MFSSVLERREYRKSSPGLAGIYLAGPRTLKIHSFHPFLYIMVFIISLYGSDFRTKSNSFSVSDSSQQ